MKISQLAAAPAAVILAGALASSVSAQTATYPTGWVRAFPTVVRDGTRPTITWNINYPSGIHRCVHVGGSSLSGSSSLSSSSGEIGTLTPLEELDVEVRVVGTCVTTTDSNGKVVDVPAEAAVSYDGGSYQTVFFNTDKKVKPDKVVWKGRVHSGKPIRFGGRYKQNNSWSPAYSSESGTNNIVTLADGQVPPIPPSSSIQSCIKPYLDSTGKVTIGPLDSLVLMELTHSDADASNPGYGHQDLVLLVSFKKLKSNNGHGNNIDGVDSSNPGHAPFADYDSDPTVDDEGSGGGAYPSK